MVLTEWLFLIRDELVLRWHLREEEFGWDRFVTRDLLSSRVASRQLDFVPKQANPHGKVDSEGFEYQEEEKRCGLAERSMAIYRYFLVLEALRSSVGKPRMLKWDSPEASGRVRVEDYVYLMNQPLPLLPFSRTSLRTGETVSLPAMKTQGKRIWAVNLANRYVATVGARGEIEVYDPQRNLWTNAVSKANVLNVSAVLLINGRLLTVVDEPDIKYRNFYKDSKVCGHTADILDPEGGWSESITLADPERGINILWSDGKLHKRWLRWRTEYSCYGVMQKSNKDLRMNVKKGVWDRQDVIGYVVARIETLPSLRLTMDQLSE